MDTKRLLLFLWFYADCNEDIYSSGEFVEKPDYEEHKHVIDQKFCQEEFNDTIEGEKEFGDKAKETSRDVCSDEIEPASIATERTLSCSGKDYKNRVALAIHSRKTHGKCSYLGSAVTALQFNECEIKYPVKTKLKRHMATRHHGNLFENVLPRIWKHKLK